MTIVDPEAHNPLCAPDGPSAPLGSARSIPRQDPLCALGFRLVLAYEDSKAWMRARPACQQIYRNAIPGPLPALDSWKFDWLAFPSMGTLAAQAAAGADLVVLAPHEREKLPCSVKEWIRSTIAPPSQPPKAWLVLMGPGIEYPNPLQANDQPLRELATTIGVSFWFIDPVAPTRRWFEPGHSSVDLDLVSRAILPGDSDCIDAPLRGCMANRHR